jgi:hypothetical protein
MLLRSLFFLLLFSVLTAGSMSSYAQNADDRTSSLLAKPGEDDRDRPKSIKESLEKMRINQEKKEYTQMLERGEEALKLSEQLEKDFAQNGKLTQADHARIANIEKLTKKIRSDLGGNDDSDSEEKGRQVMSAGEAVKSLRAMTISMYDELKKTSRFTISAAAIESTNALLKVTRFLRITK